MVPDKIAADVDAARRINMPIDGRLQVLDYVVWLSLQPKHFNRRDIVTAEMSRINVATPVSSNLRDCQDRSDAADDHR